jgi:hypothetical protein
MAYPTRAKEVYEIFEEFEKIKSRKDKVEFLRSINTNIAVRDICHGTFDQRIVWLLPKGPVPYTPNNESSYPSTLLKKHRDFQYFAKGGPGTKLPAVKRENMFITLLESIHPKDAKLVEAMINKKNVIKGLTKKIVQEAYPELKIPDDPKKEK